MRISTMIGFGFSCALFAVPAVLNVAAASEPSKAAAPAVNGSGSAQVSSLSTLAGGSSVIIGWDFREVVPYYPGCSPTFGPAKASHDSVGVQGEFYHTAAGCDAGSNGFAWVTSTLNNTNRFPYLGFTTSAPITLQEIRLRSVENDPIDFGVALELSPANSPAPTTAQPGTNYSLLGSFTSNSGDWANKAVTLANPITLQPGTYYIRLRPQTTPVISTSWIAFDHVVLVGSISY